MDINKALQRLDSVKVTLDQKRDEIRKHLSRTTAETDRLASRQEGGSSGYIQRLQQSVRDLESYWLQLKSEIQRANMGNTLTISGTTRTVFEWLAWRGSFRSKEQRNEASMHRRRYHDDDGDKKSDTVSLAERTYRFNRDVDEALQEAIGRVDAQNRGKTPEESIQLVTNIDETEFAKDKMNFEFILSELDAELSTFNATTQITIGDIPQ